MFQKFSPQFGATPSKADLTRFASSTQFNGDVFNNQIPTSTSSDFKSMMVALWEFVRGTPNRTPENGIKVLPVSTTDLANSSLETRILWFGHSTFLLQMDGLNLLFDPMLSDVPAPHPWVGSKRYSSELPIEPEDLPNIDAVFISHDHYDHLDYASILKLNERTNHFYVPLGVGSHLRAWGIEDARITELDWWDDISIENTKFTFAPARHFSGRKLSGQNSSLWGSWHIAGTQKTVFFSGDTGYGPHFEEISARLDPIDFALLECGQYDEKWSDIHMLPEQTIQASVDLKAKAIMPVHWAAFTLSLHSWTDPVERASAAAKKAGQSFVVPQIGELIILDNEPKSRVAWWNNQTTSN